MPKRCALLPAALLLALLAAGCTQPTGQSTGQNTARTGGRPAVQSEEQQFLPLAPNDLLATVETTAGTIQLVLYPDEAPIAVQNFCALANEGYYNGTPFHRVVEDFCVQGGDGTGTGEELASAYPTLFPAEYSPRLRHYAGALCTAGEAAATAGEARFGSQFYIVAVPADALDDAALATLRAAGFPEAAVDAYAKAGGAPYLDYTDTVFGQVVSGMDVVDAIARAKADEEGRPKDPVTIERITISRYAGADA